MVGFFLAPRESKRSKMHCKYAAALRQPDGSDASSHPPPPEVAGCDPGSPVSSQLVLRRIYGARGTALTFARFCAFLVFGLSFKVRVWCSGQHVIHPDHAFFSAALTDVEEVQVGTETQQHNGPQHVVDQVPEFGLQVALPVPVYLRRTGGEP